MACAFEVLRGFLRKFFHRARGHSASSNHAPISFQSMELYLIRHGETVDNVAGLYAGVRDSRLSTHGYQQAQRLGEHFAKTNVTFTHIFASPLTRAFKTAEAIKSKQPQTPIAITKVQDLIEQDFGYYEGKPFHARSDARKSGRESHREKHKDDPGFVDVESKDSMNARADTFLDEYMIPLFNKKQEAESGREVVAIVSHGMLLSHLWRRLLLRLPAKSLTIAPEVVAARGDIVLQHLGGWSNTGYLELALSRPVESAIADKSESSAVVPDASLKETQTTPGTGDSVEAAEDPPVIPSSTLLTGWSTLIRSIDEKIHLTGLKRQRGGIGRSAHDEGQKKLEVFFKKERAD